MHFIALDKSRYTVIVVCFVFFVFFFFFFFCLFVFVCLFVCLFVISYFSTQTYVVGIHQKRR